MAKLRSPQSPRSGENITTQWGNRVTQNIDFTLAQLGMKQGDMLSLGSNLRPQKVARPDTAGFLFHPGGDGNPDWRSLAQLTPQDTGFAGRHTALIQDFSRVSFNHQSTRSSLTYGGFASIPKEYFDKLGVLQVAVRSRATDNFWLPGNSQPLGTKDLFASGSLVTSKDALDSEQKGASTVSGTIIDQTVKILRYGNSQTNLNADLTFVVTAHNQRTSGVQSLPLDNIVISFYFDNTGANRISGFANFFYADIAVIGF